jgi:hypothetical protein
MESEGTGDYTASPDAGAGGAAPATTTPAPKLLKSHEGEHHGDYGSAVIPITRSVKVFAFCAALNSCNLGYDVGVSTNAGKLIQEQWELSDQEREIFVGALNFFSIFGALMSHYFSDQYGRRTAFKLAAVGFIVGLLVKTTATSYAMLMFGRALVGLGCGVGLAVRKVQIYVFILDGMNQTNHSPSVR